MKHSLSHFGKLLFAIFTILFVINTSHAEVKNIIVLISDGAGYNQIAASNYWHGTRQAYEDFPVAIGMSTYSYNRLEAVGQGYDSDSAWVELDYVRRRPTDSASAATAMSTGIKMYDGVLGVGINGEALYHVSQRAEELGMATGVVSSVPLSHATPAGFVAHDVSRNNYGAIAIEMIDSSACEVIMGAGHPFYNDNAQLQENGYYRYVGDEAHWNALVNGEAGADMDGDGDRDFWTLLESLEDFEAYADGYAPDRIFGVPRVRSTLQQSRSNGPGANDPQAPYTVAFNQGVPTLELMTRVALNVLDNDPDGFFVMIEGGAIDWAGHANQIGRTIEEEDDFNASCNAVIEWVEANSNWDETLVVVTGDHECGFLMGDDCEVVEDGDDILRDIHNNGAGNIPGFHFYSGNHTNSIIPFFARGIGSGMLLDYADERDIRRGMYLDNIELAQTCFRLYEEADDYAWRVRLAASVGEFSDTDNYVAGVEGADADYDQNLDRPEQPHAPEGYISLYFPHQNWMDLTDNFRTDVVAPTAYFHGDVVWNFAVDTDVQNADVTLDFSPYRVDASRFTMTLVDGNQRIDVLDQPSYEYNSGNGGVHNFQLILGSYADSHDFNPGWTLFSLPLNANDACLDMVMGDDLQDENYYVYGYSQANGGCEISGDEMLECGKGYWLGLLADGEVDVNGAYNIDPVTIRLEQGWNIVGGSFLNETALASAMILRGADHFTIAEAADNNMVQPVLYGFEAANNNYTEDNVFTPWMGYWFKALSENLSLVIVPDMQQVARDDAQDGTPNDWHLTVKAEMDGASDQITRLGVYSEATDGFDAAYDYPEPPAPPQGDFITACFVHNDWPEMVGSRFNRDIRSPEGSLVWEMTISASTMETVVTLTWPEIDETLPEGGNMVIEDLVSGARVDMMESNHYSYLTNGDRQFRLSYESNGIEESTGSVPESFYLSACHPNPFNSMTTISFGLPVASKLTMRVYDSNGRQVAKLANSHFQAGNHTVEWNAGRASSGLYIINMEAEGFSASSRVQLVR